MTLEDLFDFIAHTLSERPGDIEEAYKCPGQQNEQWHRCFFPMQGNILIQWKVVGQPSDEMIRIRYNRLDHWCETEYEHYRQQID